MKESHVIDWKSGKVIDICHQLYPRCYLESWYIKTKGSKINRDEGLLPQVYGSLVKHIKNKNKIANPQDSWLPTKCFNMYHP